MSDNISITSGSGLVIKTDDIGGVHYQQIKLVDGNLESTAPTGVKNNPFIVSVQNTVATTVISGGVTLLSSGTVFISGGVTLLSGDVTVLNTGAYNVTVLNTKGISEVSGNISILNTGGLVQVSGNISVLNTVTTVAISNFTGGTVSIINTGGTTLVSGGVSVLNSGPFNVTVLAAPASSTSGGITLLSSIYLPVNVGIFTAGTVSLLNTATPGFVSGGVSILSMPAVSLSGGVTLLSSVPLYVTSQTNTAVMVSTATGLVQVTGLVTALQTGGLTILSSTYLNVNVNTFTAGTVSLLNTPNFNLVTGTVTTVPSGTTTISGGVTLLSSVPIYVASQTNASVMVSTGTGLVQVTGGVSVLVSGPFNVNVLTAPASSTSGGITLLSSIYLPVNINTFTAGTVSLLNTATPGMVTGGVSMLSSCIVMVSSGPGQVGITGGVTVLVAPTTTITGGITLLSSTVVMVSAAALTAKFQITGGVSLLSSTMVMVSAAALTAKFQTTGGVSVLSSCVVSVSGGVTLLSSAPVFIQQGSTAYSALGYIPTWIYVALSSNNQTVVWKPTAAKRFNIVDLTVSALTAGLVTFTQDTAATVTIMKVNLAANGGWATNFNTPLISTQTNHGLAVTSAVAGTNTYLLIMGYESV